MPRPESALRSVFCATCYAGPGEMCSDPRSTRWTRVGYHAARKRELEAKLRDEILAETYGPASDTNEDAR